MLQCIKIVVFYFNESRSKRTKIFPGHGIVGKRNDRSCPSVEIILANDDLCLVFGNSLFLIAPLPTDLYGRLNSFGPCIHRKQLVVAKSFRGILLEPSQNIVIK